MKSWDGYLLGYCLAIGFWIGDLLIELVAEIWPFLLLGILCLIVLLFLSTGLEWFRTSKRAEVFRDILQKLAILFSLGVMLPFMVFAVVGLIYNFTTGSYILDLPIFQRLAEMF